MKYRNSYRWAISASALGLLILNSGSLYAQACVSANTSPTSTTPLDDCSVANTALTNSGQITASPSESSANVGGAGSSLSNSGTLTATGRFGALVTGNNATVTNSGVINGGFSGINLSGTGVTIINNVGATITASGLTSTQFGIQNDGNGTVITNFGTITTSPTLPGTGYGIGNQDFGSGDRIAVLSNAQGGSNPLTYRGSTVPGFPGLTPQLPVNYNIIINNPTSFGRLVASEIGSSTTTFGIYAGSNVQAMKYERVLSGFAASNLNATSGVYGGYSWALILESGSSTIWDLIFAAAGPSATDTQASLVNTSQALQSTYTLQNSVLANSLEYDCNKFGSNGVCISTGGRYTAVSAANGLNNTSALLIAAYRLNQNYRIGAYIDQNLSVNNAGTTVRLGNSTPLIGLFGAWNEKPDGTGTEIKVSAAYGKKNTTINRQVVGTSEPGAGSSQLNSQGAQVTIKHSVAVTDKAIVSPYVGMRYTQNNMNGYTEGISDTVTAPLAFSALNTRATTALAGVGVNYKVNPTVTTFASAGVEADTKTGNGSYSGTNSNISDLTAVNFNANPVKVRASAVLGAYRDVEKSQRFTITGIFRQEAYQSVSTRTLLATYTVGL